MTDENIVLAEEKSYLESSEGGLFIEYAKELSSELNAVTSAESAFIAATLQTAGSLEVTIAAGATSEQTFLQLRDGMAGNFYEKGKELTEKSNIARFNGDIKFAEFYAEDSKETYRLANKIKRKHGTPKCLIVNEK